MKEPCENANVVSNYKNGLQVKRLRRALHRFYAGNALRGKYYMVTLTTPDWLEVTDKTLSKAFIKFKLRLSRIGYRWQYFGVKEYNKKNTALHLHLVVRADKPVCQLLIRVAWTESLCGRLIFDKISTGTVICFVKKQYGDQKGLANYLAKYLVKAIGENETGMKRRGFWYSYEWIFKRWSAVHKIAWRYCAKIDNQYWHDIRGDLTKVYEWYRILRKQANEWGLIVPWSITFSKELKRLGIEWYGNK